MKAAWPSGGMNTKWRPRAAGGQRLCEDRRRGPFAAADDATLSLANGVSSRIYSKAPLMLNRSDGSIFASQFESQIQGAPRDNLDIRASRWSARRYIFLVC